jgi:hypothetical protein
VARWLRVAPRYVTALFRVLASLPFAILVPLSAHADCMIYFRAFFMRFPKTAFDARFGVTDLLASAFVKCSPTLAAS